MSQITFRGKESYWRVVIGWDNPLETFFAQVWDERNVNEWDDPMLVLWVGVGTAEVVSIEELEFLLAPFATLSREHWAALEASEARRTPPTELQRLARRLFA